MGDSVLNRLRQLEYAERTARQVALEAACAQRLLSDEAFLGFLDQMSGNAANMALYAEHATDREIGRIKVLLMEELRGRLVHAAGYLAEQKAEEQRGRSFE